VPPEFYVKKNDNEHFIVNVKKTNINVTNTPMPEEWKTSHGDDLTDEYKQKDESHSIQHALHMIYTDIKLMKKLPPIFYILSDRHKKYFQIKISKNE